VNFGFIRVEKVKRKKFKMKEIMTSMDRERPQIWKLHELSP
jgi:hypothetical protein